MLDLSRVLAGPWCTMLLGDAGASVIKVERPVVGDETRSWGPPFLPGNVSTYYLSVNRNKKSIAVDMKHPEGIKLCHRLATEWADVIVENFKVGTMERLGLDYETLSTRNPGLVYCSVTGFGPSGPFANLPGYDVIVSGMYGLMSITGDENGGPAKVGVAITDVLTGSLAYGGILTALYERNRTGRGQKIDVSLMETQLAGLVNIASSALNSAPNQPPPKRWGTAHESIVPYQTFRCKPASATGESQFIVVGAGNDQQFASLCNILGLANVANDIRFRSNADRVANRTMLIDILEKKFIEKSRDEWLILLDNRGFPVGPVRTIPEAFQCEQAVHRRMVQDLTHPVAGNIRLPRSPITYATAVGDDHANCHPPMLGEHTEEILTEILEHSAEEIARLENDCVIQRWKPSSPSSSL